MAVLITVEIADALFAVDSIPAIFAITTDTFVVWTSNSFAILGLRALYFMLAGLIKRFMYLSIGLSILASLHKIRGQGQEVPTGFGGTLAGDARGRGPA